QLTADLEAVHAGHHHVEEDDVAKAAAAHVERLGAAISGDDLEILGRQPRLEQLDVGNDVVDDKDARGHSKAPSRVADIGLHSLDALGHRDRPRQVGLAAALTDPLFVALHGEGSDGDDGDCAQFVVFLDPFGDFQPGYLGQQI